MSVTSVFLLGRLSTADSGHNTKDWLDTKKLIIVCKKKNTRENLKTLEFIYLVQDFINIVTI